MILANGCPKSGTHALMAWLEGLGLKRMAGVVKVWDGSPRLRAELDGLPCIGDFIHSHIPFGYDVGSHRVITIILDPRNVLLSYARWLQAIGKNIMLTPLRPLQIFKATSSFRNTARSSIGAATARSFAMRNWFRAAERRGRQIPTRVRHRIGASTGLQNWNRPGPTWAETIC